MRNLKRVLSLALASVMLLGMMVIGAGAADKTAADLTDMDQVTNKEAVSLMVDLGVIEGKPDGSYAPAEGVDRATMAKLITYVLMGDVDPVIFEGTTTDLTDIDGQWAEGYIKYCYANGIISGDGLGHFFPTQGVTVVQAAKMLLVALGYDAEIQGYVGSSWSINIMKDAQKAGLINGIDAKATDALTRDDAALLIYNALFAKTAYYSEVLYGDKVQFNATTLGQETYGLYAVKGTLVANEYAALESTVASKGYSKVKLADGDVKNVKVTSTVDQLGHEVVYYTKDSVNGTLISSAVAETGKTTVLSDSTGKTFAAFAKANDLTLTGAKYSVNYGAAAGSMAEPAKGETVVYINTDGTGAVEYIIKTQYTFSQVTAVNATKGTITIGGLGTRNVADINGADKLAKDDYVLFVQLGSTILVEKAQSITGTVTSVTSAKDKVTINGTSYGVGADGCEGNAATSATVTAGYEYVQALNVKDAKECTFYLDKAGAIALVVGEKSAAAQYALVTNLKVTADEWDSTKKVVEAKVVLADGTQQTVTLADNDSTSNSSSLMEKAKTESSETTPDYSTLTGKVYAYTVSDSKYAMSGTAATTTKSSVEYKTGAPKIASDVLVNDSTVVLYYKVADDGKEVITSYTGINNLPNMAARTSMEVVMQAAPNDNYAAFIYVNAEAAKEQSDAQYAYAYTTDYSTTASGKVYPVVVDGEIVELTVKADAANLVKNHIYTFTTDADGISTLVDKGEGETAVIDSVGTDFIVVDGTDIVYLGDYTVDDLTSFNSEGKLVPSTGALAADVTIVYLTQNVNGTPVIVKAYVVPTPAVEGVTVSKADNTLTATVVGASDGTVSYQWKKDGVEIDGATSSTYTVTENGSYTVTVTVTSKLDGTTSVTKDSSAVVIDSFT